MVKKTNAMTHRTKPRAAPNRKPSDRSSAPTFESSTASDKLTVMMETRIRATKKIAVAEAIDTHGSLLM